MGEQLASRIADNEGQTLRCALKMALEGCRILRVAENHYRELVPPLRRALAQLTLVHADMGKMLDAQVIESRERLRLHMAKLQVVIDALTTLPPTLLMADLSL